MGLLVHARQSSLGTLKVISRMASELMSRQAVNFTDSKSRPTLTKRRHGHGRVGKKDDWYGPQNCRRQEAPPTDKLYDFSLVKKAHATLQAKAGALTKAHCEIEQRDWRG